MALSVWGAWHKNDELRLQSSSGGVFTALASAVIAKNGIVFGSAMDMDTGGQYHCRHMACENDEELAKLRGSKYTVSELGDVFSKVEAELIREREVLFSGTPCQVAALQCYLGKPYENLVTVDFICHGVPAPELLSKKINEIQTSKSKIIKDFQFRDKTEGWIDFSVKLTMSDNSIYRKKLEQSRFMQLFLSDLFLRPSCYRCRFKDENHKSDITLGDYWGVKEYLDVSDEDIFKGISVIAVQTEKGEAALSTAMKELTLLESNVKYFSKSNLPYKQSVHCPIEAPFFRMLLSQKSTESIFALCTRTKGIRTFVNRVVRKIKKVLKLGESPADKTRLPDSKNCCGCMNCKSLCPTGAISIRTDALGFQYQVTDSTKCIQCGRCVKKCPLCE